MKSSLVLILLPSLDCIFSKVLADTQKSDQDASSLGKSDHQVLSFLGRSLEKPPVDRKGRKRAEKRKRGNTKRVFIESDLLLDPSAISRLNPEAGFHLQEGMETYVVPHLPKLAEYYGGLISSIISVVGLSVIVLSILPVAFTDLILFILRRLGMETIRQIVAWLTGMNRRSLRSGRAYSEVENLPNFDTLIELADSVLDSVKRSRELYS